MSTTILAWLIAILGLLMIAGGIWDVVDLWNQRKQTVIPLSNWGMAIGMICGGFGTPTETGEAQTTNSRRRRRDTLGLCRAKRQSWRASQLIETRRKPKFASTRPQPKARPHALRPYASYLIAALVTPRNDVVPEELSADELRAQILAQFQRAFPEYRLVPAKRLKVSQGRAMRPRRSREKQFCH